MDVLALEHNLFTKPGGNSLEWNVRIRSREYELGGSYSIKVFLGDVPEVQSDWTGSPNYVGSHSVYTFATSEEEGDGLEVEGFVSLQRALEKRSQLQPYEPKVVVPYLKENLHWRVVTPRGRLMNDRLKSLDMTVFTIDHRNPEGDSIKFPECTEGKDGF